MRLRCALPLGLLLVSASSAALWGVLGPSEEPSIPASRAAATDTQTGTTRPAAATAAPPAAAPSRERPGTVRPSIAGRTAGRTTPSAFAPRRRERAPSAAPEPGPGRRLGRRQASAARGRRLPRLEDPEVLVRTVARLERRRRVQVRLTQLRRRIGLPGDDPAAADLELLLSREPSPFSRLAEDPRRADVDWLLGE